MRQGRFSTLACYSHFVTTFGAQPTAANPGQSCKPMELQVEVTRNGSLSTRPTAWGMASSTRLGAPPPLATLGNSAVPQMAVSPGRVLLVFLTLSSGEHSTWIQTAISLSAAQPALAARFTAFAQATHRIRTLHRLLIKSPRSTLAAVSISATLSIQAAWKASRSWPWTVPADLLTTTFT